MGDVPQLMIQEWPVTGSRSAQMTLQLAQTFDLYHGEFKVRGWNLSYQLFCRGIVFQATMIFQLLFFLPYSVLVYQATNCKPVTHKSSVMVLH